MKKNNKGFTLLETLIVSTFVLSTLIFLYIQFSAIKRSYDSSFKYNTINGLYSARMFADYIKEDGYSDAIAELDSSEFGYVDVTNCIMFNSLCSTIKNSINAEQIIITHNDISVLQNKLSTSKDLDSYFNTTFKKFILTIDSKTTNEKDRLIIRFIDENGNETFTDVTIGDSKEFTIYENGTAVYYNPTTGEKCTESEAVSTTGTKSGCMKWYTFNDSEGSGAVNLILDHNTTVSVAWNSSGSNETGMKEVKEVLENDTNNWKVPARLITANEIAKITNHPTFDSNKTGQTLYCLATNKQDSTSMPYCNKETNISMNWLFDYTYCVEGSNDWGCSHNDTSTIGYWTSTPYTGSSSQAWSVHRYGNLVNISVSNTNRGVRPVITIKKSILEEN